MLDATNEWYFNIDQGNTNVVVFLDLAKAFDTVSHEILLNKLGALSIQSKFRNFRSEIQWNGKSSGKNFRKFRTTF